MKFINYNYVSDEEARQIMETMGYEATSKEESTLKEDSKKGYPEKGIKPGTKAAKEEEDDSKNESVEVEGETLVEYFEFDGDTYSLSEQVFESDNGDLFLKLHRVDEGKVKGLDKKGKDKLQASIDKEKEDQIANTPPFKPKTKG